MSKASLSKLGDAAFERTDKVSAELLALTYGSFVRQLLIDYEDAEEVNAQLAKMGYNIGTPCWTVWFCVIASGGIV